MNHVKNFIANVVHTIVDDAIPITKGVTAGAAVAFSAYLTDHITQANVFSEQPWIAALLAAGTAAWRIFRHDAAQDLDA